MASIFSMIASGDIPSYKVAENDSFYAFLDINPLVKGHTLVIPKKEVDKLFDLDDETYMGLMAFAKYVSHGIEKSFDCDRVAMTVIGLEVPHAHVHLVPINTMGDIDFSRPKLKLEAPEMKSIADLISSNL